MSKRAWTYIWLVFVATAAACGAALLAMPSGPTDWMTVGAFAVLATLSQLFKVEAPSHQTYHVTTIFLYAAALLLHPILFAGVVLVSYVIEWIKERVVNSQMLRKWYLQPFNICTHVLAGFAAKGVFLFFVVPTPSNLEQPNLLTVEAVLGMAAGVATYVAVNHAIVGLALVLARGISWRESGIMDPETLITESVLLFMGAVTAVLWTINPWLVVPALSPLALIYKTLTIPQLKHDAQIDGKTGLMNAKHFTDCFTAELDRARRFNRPLALIIADLDLLRNVNNTYGHLAGDKVLAEVGRVIRETIREYDIAGRFGGEEFALVLPEVEEQEARSIGERLREAVEHTSINISTSDTPIHVTMSLGVAARNENVSTLTELLHAADVAVYQAKLQGRNRVICISDVPHSLELETVGATERLQMPKHNYEYIPRPSDNGYAEVAEDQSQVAAIVHPAESSAPMRAAIMQNAQSERAGAVGQRVEGTGPLKSRWTAASTGKGGLSPALSQRILAIFVSIVILLGLAAVGASIVGYFTWDRWSITGQDLAMLGILIAMAMLAEYFQITLYGPDTLSVSMALNFAAAPIVGIPGVAAVSLAIAFVHFLRRRPALYKTAFNWSTHLLAGLPAVFFLDLPRNIHLLSQVVIALFTAMITAVAYFILDTGLVAAAIALASNSGLVSMWRERFQWLAGHYLALGVTGLLISAAYFAMGPVSVVAFLVPIALMRYAQKQYVERTESSVRELKRMNAELTLANREVLLANVAIHELNEELFLTLSKIIDARDPYVGGHAAKVSDYAVAIAREIGIEEGRLEPLRQAGFLHDIGKIGISEQVLHKPSKLTDEEYEYVKKHAALGAEFLETCRGLRHLAPFVRHHHERWDGRGYPDRLAAEEIELEARILAVCDAAEAMASDRPYRKGMSLDEMIEEIKRCAGTQFDPVVAAAFVKVVERERDRLVTNSAQEVLKKYTEPVVLSPMRNGSSAHASQNGHKPQRAERDGATESSGKLAPVAANTSSPRGSRAV